MKYPFVVSIVFLSLVHSFGIEGIKIAHFIKKELFFERNEALGVRKSSQEAGELVTSTYSLSIRASSIKQTAWLLSHNTTRITKD